MELGDEVSNVTTVVVLGVGGYAQVHGSAYGMGWGRTKGV
jgi:hypothetical protein